ncbi:MAG: TetR/AcrR family hemagglutinin/protease transcriptional regulator [Gammaproteobacteria bacterium]
MEQLAKIPRRMDRHARRQQLIECAVSVYADQGITGATHTEVAERANVSIPTVFAYFPTKDEMSNAVLSAVESVLWDIVDQVKKSKHEVPETFLRNYQRFTQTVESNPNHIRIWLVWGTAINDPNWPRYLKLQDEMISAHTKVLKKGQRQGSIASNVDVGDAARMLVANSHMVALMIFSGIERQRMDRYIEHILESSLSLKLSRQKLV